MRWLQKLFGKPASTLPRRQLRPRNPHLGLSVNWPYPRSAVRGAGAPTVLAEMATAAAGRSLAGPAGSPGRTRHAFARHVARRPDGRDPVYYAPERHIVQRGTETLRLAAITGFGTSVFLVGLRDERADRPCCPIFYSKPSMEDEIVITMLKGVGVRLMEPADLPALHAIYQSNIADFH
ncbi:MAG: hypothetical protein U1F77_01555 [Kiritimatiellia bacterium]